MNKILTIFAVFLFLTTCEKNKEILNPYVREYWGNISITKNGELWNPKIIGTSSSLLKNTYNLEITIIENNLAKRNLIFYQLPLYNKKGQFRIVSRDKNGSKLDSTLFSDYSTLRSDDIGGDFFLVDSSKNNYINITDTTNNEITGNFEVNFIRHPMVKKYIENEDTLNFSCSYFKTRLQYFK